MQSLHRLARARYFNSRALSRSGLVLVMKDQPYRVGVDVERTRGRSDLSVREVVSTHEIREREIVAVKYHDAIVCPPKERVEGLYRRRGRARANRPKEGVPRPASAADPNPRCVRSGGVGPTRAAGWGRGGVGPTHTPPLALEGGLPPKFLGVAALGPMPAVPLRT